MRGVADHNNSSRKQKDDGKMGQTKEKHKGKRVDKGRCCCAGEALGTDGARGA